MSALLTRLWHSRNGGPAAEFTLILPVLTLFLLGMIDVGRLMWTWNQAEKATQAGARWAVVTNLVAPGIGTFDFVGQSGMTQGDIVPASAYGIVDCTQPASTVTCSCRSGSTCPGGMSLTPGTTGAAAFAAIYQRMRTIMPQLTTANVKVSYVPSGLGFAGDPSGSNVAPIVTVQIQNATFTPLVLTLFRTSFALPNFTSSLTLEDGAGTYAN